MFGLEPFLFLFTVGALFCWLGAWPGAMVMQRFSRLQGWGGEVGFKLARRVVFWALMAHAAAATVMDLITGTSQSIVLLVPTMDTPSCAPNCFIFGGSDYTPIVSSVGTYYAAVVGSGLGNWIMYAVWQIPGVIAAYFVMLSSPWEPRGVSGRIGMFTACAITIAIALAVLVPVFVTALLGLIEAAQ